MKDTACFEPVSHVLKVKKTPKLPRTLTLLLIAKFLVQPIQSLPIIEDVLDPATISHFNMLEVARAIHHSV